MTATFQVDVNSFWFFVKITAAFPAFPCPTLVSKWFGVVISLTNVIFFTSALYVTSFIPFNHRINPFISIHSHPFSTHLKTSGALGTNGLMKLHSPQVLFIDEDSVESQQYFSTICASVWWSCVYLLKAFPIKAVFSQISKRQDVSEISLWSTNCFLILVKSYNWVKDILKLFSDLLMMPELSLNVQRRYLFSAYVPSPFTLLLYT